MTTTPSPVLGGELFSGLDRALFVAAFADKLRGAGIETPISAMESYALGLDAAGTFDRVDLYWISRISFVKRRGDLAVFDRVFDSVFDYELNRTTKQPTVGKSTIDSGDDETPGDRLHRLQLDLDGQTTSSQGLMWTSRPSVGEDDPDDETDAATDLHELLPSVDPALAERAFDQLRESELAEMCRLLEAAHWRWPERPSRRTHRTNRSGQPSMRLTMQATRRTAGEALQIVRTRRRRTPRRIVMVLDVSGSMESYVRAYLHLSRVLAQRGRMEVFAVGTDIHRLTPALRNRSAVEAMKQATDAVGDRFGGTRLATGFANLLNHRVWGQLLRGSIVVMVSDGWDTDPAEEMNKQMQRLARRAKSIVWINPRVAAPEFEPKVASMAAALPYCDEFLSGHSLNAMTTVMGALTD